VQERQAIAFDGKIPVHASAIELIRNIVKRASASTSIGGLVV
jgi:hypothetical protein